MATDDRYLTLRNVTSVVLGAVMVRLSCVRRGHDPVVVGRAKMCRRCYGMVR